MPVIQQFRQTQQPEANPVLHVAPWLRSGRVVVNDMKRETELSKALRKWQEREKLNQPSAAAKLGVPFGSYRNWVGGRRVPSAATLAHIESVTKQKAA